jgi:signal transduction histidine kinase/YHS domain-containing protein
MASHVQSAQSEALSHLRALTLRQESERARIAHELHDDTVQALVAIGQSIQFADALLENDPARARTMLNAAWNQSVDSVKHLRRIIANLRPPALEELGVVSALALLTQQVSAIDGKLVVIGVARRISELQELALFRIAQEAIHNAEIHGHPSQIALTLEFLPYQVSLSIRDDGTGFRVPRSLEVFEQHGRYGLIEMRERARELNGSLEMKSRPGQGTVVRVTLPLEAVHQPTSDVHDPVCGALIGPQQAYSSAVYGGQRFYFCCPVCEAAFQHEPDLYASPKPR